MISEVLAHSDSAADDDLVLSTATSPGHGEFASLLASAVITPGTNAVPVPTTVVKAGDSGVPDWALVAIALGVPFAASGAHARLAAAQGTTP